MRCFVKVARADLAVPRIAANAIFRAASALIEPAFVLKEMIASKMPKLVLRLAVDLDNHFKMLPTTEIINSTCAADAGFVAGRQLPNDDGSV